MSNQINLDTRGVLTVKDQAGQPVKIVIKLAGKGYGNGRIVGDRQYQVCRYVPTIDDRGSPAQVAPAGLPPLTIGLLAIAPTAFAKGHEGQE